MNAYWRKRHFKKLTKTSFPTSKWKSIKKPYRSRFSYFAVSFHNEVRIGLTPYQTQGFSYIAVSFYPWSENRVEILPDTGQQLYFLHCSKLPPWSENRVEALPDTGQQSLSEHCSKLPFWSENMVETLPDTGQQLHLLHCSELPSWSEKMVETLPDTSCFPYIEVSFHLKCE